jgi:hypothetical protein
MSKEISNFVMPKNHSGRFVQHYLNNAPFICFGLNDEETHPEISARLIEEYESSIHPPSIIKHPSGKGFYRIVKGVVYLYGDKYQEELNPSQEHLNKLRLCLPEGIKLEIAAD